MSIILGALGGGLLYVALVLACGRFCGTNTRTEPERPECGDPDATADDYDDDHVERITKLPPVPLPDRWTEADDAMLSWFVAGGADR